jgi:hypothetical protein
MAYTTIAEIRAEGITVAQATDSRITSSIALATRKINDITGFVFESTAKTYILDGSGLSFIKTPQPIISITSVKIDGVAQALTDYKVYSGQGNEGFPHIQYADRNSEFESGFQNVEIVGTFGYLDESNAVPADINYACKKLTIRELGLMGEDNEYKNYGIISESVPGHSYTRVASAISNGLTGDLEVDRILVSYANRHGMSVDWY